MAFRVLITDRFDADALAVLKADPRLDVRLSRTHLPTPEELKEARALIIRSRTSITAQLLEQAPLLEVIVTATSGFDHLDLRAIAERPRVKAMHTPWANVASTAELTWALVLACARRITEAHRAVKAGEWSREKLLGHQLHGKTYGIVGLGRIGSRVAHFAQSFGMNVVAFDPYVEEFPPYVTRVGFEELLRLADIVSFHVPATEETRFMLTQSRLELMNRHAILVNTCRGSIVKEQDLTLALSQGWIAACGLDVFEREPLPRDSGLLAFPNVVMSPHIGATTTEAFAAASREAAGKVLSYLDSQQVTDQLPPRTPWFEFGVY